MCCTDGLAVVAPTGCKPQATASCPRMWLALMFPTLVKVRDGKGDGTNVITHFCPGCWEIDISLDPTLPITCKDVKPLQESRSRVRDRKGYPIFALWHQRTLFPVSSNFELSPFTQDGCNGSRVTLVTGTRRDKQASNTLLRADSLRSSGKRSSSVIIGLILSIGASTNPSRDGRRPRGFCVRF